MSMMDTAQRIANHFSHSLSRSAVYQRPFRHWVLTGTLPADILASIVRIPAEVPSTNALVGNQRSALGGRFFFSPANRTRYRACDDVARAFQSMEVSHFIERYADTKITNTRLRIEYTQDRDGYYLEPHTDTIDPKRFTLVVTLPRALHLEAMGTDLYDNDHSHVSTQPRTINGGLAFVPGSQTWHGFSKKPIDGIRRSLVVNYVGNGWPQTLDLSFPELMAGQSS